jgi:hypothetical protein
MQSEEAKRVVQMPASEAVDQPAQPAHGGAQTGTVNINPQRLIFEVGKLHLQVNELADQLNARTAQLTNLQIALKTTLAECERLKGENLGLAAGIRAYEAKYAEGANRDQETSQASISEEEQAKGLTGTN